MHRQKRYDNNIESEKLGADAGKKERGIINIEIVGVIKYLRLLFPGKPDVEIAAILTALLPHIIERLDDASNVVEPCYVDASV